MMRSKTRWVLGGFTALVVAGVAWATPGSGVTSTILNRPVMLDEIDLKSSADTHKGAEAEQDSREALSLSVATTITASPSLNNTAEALALDPPAAPSHCKVEHYTIHGYSDTFYKVSWKDNSTNEDGFILELWWQNPLGIWLLGWSMTTEGTTVGLTGKPGPNNKLRVKAFNAAGDSAWSNWAH